MQDKARKSLRRMTEFVERGIFQSFPLLAAGFLTLKGRVPSFWRRLSTDLTIAPYKSYQFV